MMQVTNCYQAADVRKWFATPNSCMIISYDLFASLTGPVVHKAERRKEQQRQQQQQLGASGAGVCVPETYAALKSPRFFFCSPAQKLVCQLMWGIRTCGLLYCRHGSGTEPNWEHAPIYPAEWRERKEKETDSHSRGESLVLADAFTRTPSPSHLSLCKIALSRWSLKCKHNSNIYCFRRRRQPEMWQTC